MAINISPEIKNTLFKHRGRTSKPTKEVSRKGWTKQIQYDLMYGNQALDYDEDVAGALGMRYSIGLSGVSTTQMKHNRVEPSAFQGSRLKDIMSSIAPQHRIQALSHPIVKDIIEKEQTAYNARLKTLYNQYRKEKGPGRPKTFENWRKDFYKENPSVFKGGLDIARFTAIDPLRYEGLMGFIGAGNKKQGEKIISNLTPKEISKIVTNLQVAQYYENIGDYPKGTVEPIYQTFIDFLDYRQGTAYSRETIKSFTLTPQGDEVNFSYYDKGKDYEYGIKFFRDELTKDIGNKGVTRLYEQVRDRLKEQHPGVKITKKDIENAIRNSEDLLFFVKNFNITDPTQKIPIESFMDALSFLKQAETLENLKLPGIGQDVMEWYKSMYATQLSREDLEFIKDERMRKRAIELYDKQGGLNEGQIAYLNRITRGLIGAIKPPTVDDILDALKKGIRRQIPRIQIRVENWFKNAQKEFNGSELLPVLYDLASRVADAKGYKELFNPDTEINLWYHNWGPDDERIMSIIKALEESSGMSADWSLLAGDADEFDNNPLNKDILMAYEYFIDKYGKEESFPDFIYDYFVEQGVIKSDRKK